LLGTGVQHTVHSVTLAWPASSTPPANGYNVYRATVPGEFATPLNSTLISVPTTQFTDSTVKAGQTYYYAFTVVDASNIESTYSNEVTATIPTL
jgi:fibronectin type 3 domain-containing protein